MTGEDRSNRTLLWAIDGLTAYVDAEYFKRDRLLTCLQHYYSSFSIGTHPVEDVVFSTGNLLCCENWDGPDYIHMNLLQQHVD